MVPASGSTSRSGHRTRGMASSAPSSTSASRLVGDIARKMVDGWTGGQVDGKRCTLSRPFLPSPMNRSVLSILACAPLASAPALAQSPAAVTLTRLQCGTNAAPTDVGQRFSDTYAYNGLKVQLTFSCYLIGHGKDYLIWDTGNPVGAAATAPKTSLTDLLAQL